MGENLKTSFDRIFLGPMSELSKQVSLGELARIQQGKYLAPNQMAPVRSVDFPVPVVGGNKILGYTISSTTSRRMPLVTCRGSNCGLVQYPSEPVWVSNNAMAFDAGDQEQNDFLYYLLSSLDFRDVITGSAQPQITKQPLATKKVWVPDRVSWAAIAATLGALDDKIQSNRRIQELSLELARAKFDRSLHSASSTRLSDIATIVLGGTPSKSEAAFWGGHEISWINSGAANQDIILTPTDYITSRGLQNSAAKLMPPGATVLAITGATLGQVAILGIETAGNQSLVGIWGASPELNVWIHFAIQSRIGDLLTHATGAAQQHVNKQNVEQLMVPTISQGELANWGREVVPLVERAVSAASESLRLAALRDALLPELLSGTLERE